MTFEEIYDRLYLPGWSQDDKRRARAELVRVSDMEWSDWIEYRHLREGKTAEQ